RMRTEQTGHRAVKRTLLALFWRKKPVEEATSGSLRLGRPLIEPSRQSAPLRGIAGAQKFLYTSFESRTPEIVGRQFAPARSEVVSIASHQSVFQNLFFIARHTIFRSIVGLFGGLAVRADECS